MIALIPVIFSLIGLLVYVLANGKAEEIGRLVFASAFLALMLSLSHEAVRLLGR